jgi:hypothetical protein
MIRLIGNPYPGVLTTSLFAGLAALIVGICVVHARRKQYDPMNMGALTFVALTAFYLCILLLWDIWIHR